MSRIPFLMLLSVLSLAGCSQQSGTGGGTSSSSSSGGTSSSSSSSSGGTSSSSSSSTSTSTSTSSSSTGGGNDPDPDLPTTGIPDLDSFSLSIKDSSIEGFDYDGASTTITIRLADRLNQNTVPDGTEVFFTTEGGSIDEFCTLSDGACTVTIESQDPRPADGLVTILAWTLGNESFLDQDSDGLYSDPDLFNDGDPRRRDLSEPFRDENRNGAFDAGVDEFIDFDGDNTFDGPDGLFNGSFCAHLTDCSTNQFLFVWDDLEVVFSSSFASISVNPDPVVPGPVTINVTDINGNPMAVGTTIDIETDNGDVDVTSFTVGTDFGTSSVINVAGDTTPSTAIFRVNVTSVERGIVTPFTTTFSD